MRASFNLNFLQNNFNALRKDLKVILVFLLLLIGPNHVYRSTSKNLTTRPKIDYATGTVNILIRSSNLNHQV